MRHHTPERASATSALAACLALGLGVAIGCGEKPKAKKKDAGQAAASASTATTARETAPERETAGPLAPVDPLTKMTLDGGRVDVFSPQGWFRAPRSSSYLVRYTPGPQKTHPTVTVYAADPPAGTTAVAPGNHADFVTAVAAGLDAGSLVKKPAPLEIGPHLGVAWVTKGEAKVGGLTQPVERSHVAVVVGGRMYTVEAEAPKGRVDAASRAAARAVAAALVAAAPAEPPPAEPAAPEAAPAEPKPAEPAPAETKPAEPAPSEPAAGAPAPSEPAPAEPEPQPAATE